MTYLPDHVLDGLTDSAWRCDGAGVGAQITIGVGAVVPLRQLTVIPGYAKTDPADGIDRYAQDRRVPMARFRFDDGTAVEHTFDVDALNRSPQEVTFPTTPGRRR